MTWPTGAEQRMQDRWGWLPDHTVDEQWQNALVDYLIVRGICDSCYWAINPESRDTGGIYGHAYDPYTNTGGWGTWEPPDQRKLNLLQKLWGSDPANSGDVNGDNSIDIIDALMIAQHYVGLNPAGFIARNADVDCDGSITIVDALMVAQYYVGLLSSFNY
jgi:hypothetical protein